MYDRLAVCCWEHVITGWHLSNPLTGAEGQLKSFLLFYKLSLGLFTSHMAVFYSARANGMTRLQSIMSQCAQCDWIQPWWISGNTQPFTVSTVQHLLCNNIYFQVSEPLCYGCICVMLWKIRKCKLKRAWRLIFDMKMAFIRNGLFVFLPRIK